MADKTECEVHLKGTAYDIDEIDEIIKAAEGITDLAEREAFLRDELLRAKKDTRQSLIARAHDATLAKKLIEKYSKDATSYTEMLERAHKDLVGRNGVDTQRIRVKNILLNTLQELETLTGSVDGLRKLKGGSAEEKAVFTTVIRITREMGALDVAKMTGANKQAYIQEVLQKISKGTKPTETEKMAVTIAAYNEFTRQFMRKNGVPVKYHDAFVVKRRYDPRIIEVKGVTVWAEQMAAAVDAKASFGREMSKSDLIKKMEGIGKAILKNDALNSSFFDFGLDGKPKLKRKRELVFKSDEDAYNIFNNMSTESLAAQVQNSAWALASEAIKTNRLGYTPDATYKAVLQQITKKAEDIPPSIRKKEAGKWRQRIKEIKLHQAIGDLAGSNKYAPTGLSTLGTTAKMMNSIGLLGNAVTTAMLDPLDVARQVFYVQGKGNFGGILDWYGNFINVVKETGVKKAIMGDFSAMQELNSHLGLVTQYIATDSSMRMVRGEIAGGGIKWGDKIYGEDISKNIEKGSSTAMKIATLLPQQTAASKTASGLVGAKVFVDMLDTVKSKGMKGLNDFEMDTLKEYGLSEQDMKFLASVERFDTWGGQKILSGKLIREKLSSGDFKKQITDAAKLYGVDEDKVVNNVMEAANKYENFMVDFFSRGTPTPELAAKTALFKASNNEIINVAVGALTQFLDTPTMQLISYKELVEKMARLNGHKDGNVRDFIQAVGPQIAAHTAMHASIGFGMYLAYDAIWSGIVGKDPKFQKLMNSKGAAQREIVYDILGRTSAIPFAFEMINAGSSRYHNGNMLDMMNSPTMSLTQDLFSVANPHSNMTTKKFLKRRLPNAWFIQAVNNHLIREN